MRHTYVRDLKERGVKIWTEGGGPIVVKNQIGISIVRT
jgi:hypothetical protein